MKSKEIFIGIAMEDWLCAEGVCTKAAKANVLAKTLQKEEPSELYFLADKYTEHAVKIVKEKMEEILDMICRYRKAAEEGDSEECDAIEALEDSAYCEIANHRKTILEIEDVLLGSEKEMDEKSILKKEIKKIDKKELFLTIATVGNIMYNKTGNQRFKDMEESFLQILADINNGLTEKQAVENAVKTLKEKGYKEAADGKNNS